ncbi:FecR domain-containing protein [Pseudomonas sp.]|uniref:FecR domain-containing protein n=1 Tax=Pseudomonas sp. TaxID=306 RepID=UPI003CC5FD77
MSRISPKIPPAVLDAAIGWSLKITFNTPDAQARQAFERWLAADELHRSAWQRIQSLHGQFAALPAQAARATLNKLPDTRLQRRQLLKFAMLATAVGATGWTAERQAPWQRLIADYSTRTGEHRRWTLPDGSVLDLNTDSAASLALEEVHQLTLLRGELALATARGNPQSWRVETPDCEVAATDARFEARLMAHGTCVTVAQGLVMVTAKAAGAPFPVAAGEQWLVGKAGARPLPAPGAEHGAWRDGMLIARSLPLSQVLAELGRYRVGYLGWEATLANAPVSGNFSTVNPEQSVALIARAYGWRVRQVSRYWLRVSAA